MNDQRDGWFQNNSLEAIRVALENFVDDITKANQEELTVRLSKSESKGKGKEWKKQRRIHEETSSLAGGDLPSLAILPLRVGAQQTFKHVIVVL